MYTHYIDTDFIRNFNRVIITIPEASSVCKTNFAFLYANTNYFNAVVYTNSGSPYANNSVIIYWIFLKM